MPKMATKAADKSSLFMDAMLDALFEEPREGDLTGWIRNDPDARSGSIKFTFYLGDKLYRVTTTASRRPPSRVIRSTRTSRIRFTKDAPAATP